jgi:2-amino-4-hydroxy-6-hydroxymethyldihydropteridine diphosphokinase
MPRVYVAVGGNIDPEAKLPLAGRELRRRFPGTRFSSCFRNPAFGFAGADFYNAVAGFDSELAVEALLPQFHAVEELCGRRREAPKWAPRAMDIDLLLYGDLVAETAAYRLPRPDLLQRCYMLGPLAELAPALRHPVTGRTMADHWQELARESHALERVTLDLNHCGDGGP